MKRLVLLIAVSAITFLANGQTNNRGTVFGHFGTLAFYNTYSLGYESPDILAKNDKLTLLGSASFGGWSSTFTQANSGFQTKIGATVLYGSNKHHLELGIGATLHFDKSLKGQSFVYIHELMNSFIGYRLQNPAKKLWFKAGLGWYEALQIGVGFKL